MRSVTVDSGWWCQCAWALDLPHGRAPWRFLDPRLTGERTANRLAHHPGDTGLGCERRVGRDELEIAGLIPDLDRARYFEP